MTAATTMTTVTTIATIPITITVTTITIVLVVDIVARHAAALFRSCEPGAGLGIRCFQQGDAGHQLCWATSSKSLGAPFLNLLRVLHSQPIITITTITITTITML